MDKVTHIHIKVVVEKKEQKENQTGFPYPEVKLATSMANIDSFLDGSTVSLEQSGDRNDFKSLLIDSYPTVLLIDFIRKTTLVRLTGKELTAENIAKALVFADQLKVDQTGKYYYKDQGLTLGRKQLLGLPWGGGLFNLNIQLPKELWYLALAAGVAGTMGSKKLVPKVGYAGLSILAAKQLKFF